MTRPATVLLALLVAAPLPVIAATSVSYKLGVL
jgi:hypothetical protein